MEHTTPQSTQVLYPALRYDDAYGAIRWLCEAFGFEKQEVYDGPDGTVAHAQLALGGAVLMLGSTRATGDGPAKSPTPGGTTWSIYVYVADPDAHFVRARSAGADIILEPYDTEYGSREYAARDVEGYRWSFGTYHP